MALTRTFQSHDSTFGALLQNGLASDAAFRRFLSATIIEEWATAVHSSDPGSALPQASPLAARLVQALHALIAAESPATWSEMGSILERLQADCKALYAAFGQQGKVPADQLPTVPSSFSIQHAQQAASSFPVLQSLMGKSVRKNVLPGLEERQRKIVSAIGYYEATKAKHDRQVFAALGGAIVAMRVIPAKLTPVIRSITNSIKVSTADSPRDKRFADF